ncbi:extracellular solute-binding protein [Microbacterium indicum]|uniref:extracellular solute-binding protein n=1 Tax=Microbacterium indicum TaxID=358100 RepID=UPI0003FE8073|nr:extracellular solute-binding protein [Microbacterium indicum]
MTPPRFDVSRRQFLSLSGVAAASLALAACAPAGGGSAGSSTQTLQFWHLLSGGDGITMSGLLDEVNAAQSAYAIRPTVLSWGEPYYTKLAMAAAGGRAPDVAIMHATRALGWAPGGLLDPWDLDRLAALGVDESTFAEPIWQKGEIDGKHMSIALDAHPFVLFYNTDLCEQAGVLGSDGLLKPVSSPEEFLDMVRAVSEVSEGHGLSYGYLGDGAQMWRLFYTLYTQHGLEMGLPEGGTAELDRDAAVESLEFMQQLLDGTLADSQSDAGTAIAEFSTGRSGFLLSGVWELRTMQTAGIPFDMTMIPTLYGTPSVYADSHSFVLPHQSSPDEAKRDLTYQFVADLLKNSFDWATAGHIPAYLPITESPDYADLLPQAHYANALDYVVYDPPAWFTGSASNFQGDFAGAVQPALMTGADAGSALDSFLASVDTRLKQPNPADPEVAS